MSYDMDADDVAGPGHNNPPPDLKIGDALRDQLAGEHGALARRRDELLAMADDFMADHASVTDDETSGTLAGVIAQLNACSKVAMKTHEGVKAPYLDGSRIVDNFFFKGFRDTIASKAATLNAMQTAYLRAKAEKARREAEERERLAREEEDRKRREAEKAERERQRAEREARKAQDDAAREDAERRAAEARAKADAAREEQDRAAAARQQEAKVAASSNADRSRVRGDLAMASLRTTWKFEVIDVTKVPAAYLQVNSAIVNAAIRGKDGLRDIPGLRIFEEQEAANR